MAKSRYGYKKNRKRLRLPALGRSYFRTVKPQFKSLKNPMRNFFYKYTVVKTGISIANGVASNQGGYDFKLTDITNYAELTSLYDEYCISKVVMKFMPKMGAVGQIQSGAGAGTYNPQTSALKPLITAIDYDDATAPASRAELLEYGTARMTLPSQICTRTVTPHIAIQTYKTAVSSGYSSKAHQWVDCADNNIPHYGIKWQVESETANGAGAPLYLYDIICTYYVKFRGTR